MFINYEVLEKIILLLQFCMSGVMVLYFNL